MTQEQFLQILPAYYGCQVDYQIGKAIFVAWIPGSSNRAHGTLYFTDGWANISINQFKLILRSLDQISDEEDEIYENIFREYFGSDPTLAKSMLERRVQINARATNYLRSIGVDCDGLIQAGWAIKEGEQ